MASKNFLFGFAGQRVFTSERKMKDSNEIFASYKETGSETDFQELVSRYIDLVYSVALRLVDGDAHRAEDVSQAVFTDLSRMVRKLPADLMLGGWLHRHTCFIAANVMRSERRRQLREQQAVQMKALHDVSGPEFSRLAPIIDRAIDDLEEPDRKAILLRFYEQRDFRGVGKAIGTSEDAARMRVNRALEKLESALRRKGVTSTATALSVVLAAQAVQAAPVGLAVTVSTAVALGSSAAVSAAVPATQIIIMTTLQKTIVATAIAVATGVALYQAKQASDLRKEVQVLRLEQAPLSGMIQGLERQRAEFSNSVVALTEENTALKRKPAEVLKLRGDVGRLQEEKAEIGRRTALSKVAETPEARKFVRDQQKIAMASMYAPLARELQLPDDRREALNEALTDNVMDSVDLIISVLRDKPAEAEMERMFAQLENSLDNKMKSLLADEGFAKYDEFTRDLTAYLTAEQFKESLIGENAERDGKKAQLLTAMREEVARALANAGLPPDHQTVPILNFRNIASEAHAEKNLKLLDSIYGNVAVRARTFLGEDELKKFEEYRKKAIENSRMALGMNRTMMAPIGE